MFFSVKESYAQRLLKKSEVKAAKQCAPLPPSQPPAHCNPICKRRAWSALGPTRLRTADGALSRGTRPRRGMEDEMAAADAAKLAEAEAEEADRQAILNRSKVPPPPPPSH